MKILMIPSWYYTEEKPFAGIFFKEFAELLVEKGHTVAIVYVDIKFNRRLKNIGYGFKNVNGVKEFRYCLKNFTPKSARGVEFQERLVLRSLANLVEDNFGKPDLIHLEAFTKVYIAKYFKEFFDIPIVYTEHFSYVMKGNNKYYESKIKEALNISDVCCAVSKSLADKMKIRKLRKINVIPNIVNIQPTETKAKMEKFTVKALGSFTSIKRYDILIKAFYDFQRNLGNNVRLIIGGDGPERELLEDLIREYNLTSKISLPGEIKRKDIFEFYNTCSLFVCSSEIETFSIVTAEAICSGVPVIATRCGGPEDMITEVNGLLVDVNNIKQMSDAMSYIYKHYDKYNKTLIAKNARTIFDKNNIVKLQEKIYQEAIDGYDVK